MPRPTRRQWFQLIAAFAVWILTACTASAAAPPKVYVILWFDTEDYILPASDDAAKRLADFLTREGIRGTFKIVGEKARTLERRARQDVIDALKKHEIGYHSNWHSTQPSPAMYLSTLGWDEGVAEFDRRERPGVDDVYRVFGQMPSCYGQPGSSWAPQAFGAMRQWYMNIYLDGGRHVGLDGRPHYYGGIFNLYNLTHTIRTSLGGPTDLKQAEDRFAEARQKLLAEGGGVVSTIYHPCEFIHREFWDGVNFRRGANPPREDWKVPGTKTPEQQRIAFETFENYVRYMKRFPDVQFVTASETRVLYRDMARNCAFMPDEIKTIAAAVGSEVTFQTVGDTTLAASEVLALLNDVLLIRVAGGGPQAVVMKDTPFGPTSPPPPMTGPVTTDWSQFTRTAADVADFLAKQKRVPGTVWLGSVAVTPEAYLVALARVVTDLANGKPAPALVEMRPAPLAAAKHIADDGPTLWTWVIFPPDMRAPAMMELAKRQAWTLKPAVLHGAGR